MTSTSSVFCNHCGRGEPPFSTKIPRKSVLCPSTDITFINDEVALLEDQINVLRGKQASLLQRLNDIKSPTHSLPPEILSRIMEFDVEDVLGPAEKKALCKCKLKIYQLHSPLKLGAVSSYWRSVSLSTPRLWTSLHLKISKVVDMDCRDRNIALLHHYFKCAKSLPVSFCMDQRFPLGYTLDKHNREYILAILDVVLQEHAMRIKTIHLNGIPLWWLQSGNTQDMIYPNLETLEMSNVLGMLFMIPPIPTLRRLRLFNTSRLMLSANTITSLRISSMEKHHAVSMLVECRETLVEFIYQGYARHQVAASWLDANQIMTLPRLETFYWEFNQSSLPNDIQPIDAYVIYNLHMPSLRNLSLVHISVLSQSIISPNVFTTITHTLDNVKLRKCNNISAAGLKAFFDMIDTRRLVLDLFQDNTLIPSFKALARKCLPSLSVLRVPDWPYTRRNVDAHCLSHYISMLEIRAKGNSPNSTDEAFMLEADPIPFFPYRYWGSKEVERFTSLITSCRVQLLRCQDSDFSVGDHLEYEIDCPALYHEGSTPEIRR